MLRNGICEVAKENEKTGYVALPELADSEETLNPLLLLNNFPCINDLINGFKKEDSLELNFLSRPKKKSREDDPKCFIF